MSKVAGAVPGQAAPVGRAPAMQAAPSRMDALTYTDPKDTAGVAAMLGDTPGGKMLGGAGAAAATVAQAPGQVVRGLQDTVGQIGEPFDSHRALRGGTSLLQGAGTLGMVAAAPEIAATGAAAVGTGATANAARWAVLKLAAGFAVGDVSSDMAEQAGKKLGLSEDAINFAKASAFFLPSFAGAAAAKTGLLKGQTAFSENAQGASVSAFGGRVKAGVINTPQGAGAGVKVGGTTVTVGGRTAATQTAVSGLLDTDLQTAQAAQKAEAVAEAVSKGQPIADAVKAQEPPTPPPVMPAGMDKGELSADTVSHLAAAISLLPEEERGQGLLEAHGNLGKWIAGQGKFVGPDGQVHVVDSPKQAATLAAKLVNDEVKRQDDAEAKAAEPAAPAKGETAVQDLLAPRGQSKLQKGSEELGNRAKTLLNANPELAPAQQVALLQRQLRVSQQTALKTVQGWHASKLPTVGSKEEPVIAEKPETVAAQVDALAAGTIKTVMVPKGDTVPAVPEGIEQVDVPKGPGAGTYLYDPAKIDPKTIQEAAASGSHGDLLGHIQSKEDIAQAASTVTVTAHKPDGTEIQASEVDASKPDIVRDQARVLAERHPDAEVSVKPTDQVIGDRLAGATKGEAASEPKPEAGLAPAAKAAEVVKPEAKRIAGHDGKEVALKTPTQELAAHYRVVDLDDIIPSHDPWNFAPNPRYPQNVQQRDYHLSTEAQARVTEQGQNYDPRYVVNTNPDAVNGPPIITPDGIVLGGNSRAMARLIDNDKKASTYRAYLKEHASTFGLTADQVEGVKRPILVREVEKPADAEGMRRLGAELNKSMTGALSGSESAVSAGKNIKPETLTRISDMLNEGDGMTIRELLAKRGVAVLKMLADDGALTARERPRFVAEAGDLNEAGKSFVEDALLGTVVDDAGLLDATPKAVLNKIESSLGAIASFGAREDEWNLLPAIRAALREHAEIAARGTTVDLQLGQRGMFSGPRNPVVDTIVRALTDAPRKVRERFRGYASEAGQSNQTRLLGPPPAAFDAFNHAFSTKLTEPGYLHGLAEAAGKSDTLIRADRPAETPSAGSDAAVSEPPAETPGESSAAVPGGKDGQVAGESVKDTSPQTLRPDKPKPIAKGDRVRFTPRDGGPEREGTVKYSNALVTRISDDAGAEHTISNKKVRPAEAAEQKEPEEKPKASQGGVAFGSPQGDKEFRNHQLGDSKKTLTAHFSEAIAKGKMPKDNLALRALVREFDGKPVTDARLKEGQEALEAAIVGRAREIVEQSKTKGYADTDKYTFQRLKALYDSQPNLNVRTSTSIANQAYSTPAPLAFVASRLAGIGEDTSVYEPTAGNGMLLIGANPAKSSANELNPARAAALRAQRLSAVYQGDALKAPIAPRSVDAVVTNPPFGSIKGADGKTAKVAVDGYKIGQIDHQIAAHALEAMKDDGRATLILGANKVAGGLNTDDRIFFNWLYSHYNVASHFEVDGDLYQRQGAGWPVRVITVHGRVASDQVSPPAGTIGRVKTWGEVYERFSEGLAAAERPIPDRGPSRAEPERQGRDTAPAVRVDAARAPERADRGEPGGGPANPDSLAGTQPGPVRDRDGESAPGLPVTDSRLRPDADVAQSDRLEQGRGEPGPRQERPPVALRDRRNDPLVAPENEYQVAYSPASSKKDQGVLIPTNMRQPLGQAMHKLEDAVGDIDEFARKELGYRTVDDMHDALMGLQVDSVASAIHQMRQGKGLVVGDQTGIGKGRQAAAILRWALRQGKTPVFITVKPQLFTDMHGDLADIGTHDLKPFLVNADESITLPDGTKAFTNKKNTHAANLKKIAASGKLPDDRNAVFLTYSQINKANTQRSALEALAPNAVFVLDESHTAGGDSSTGEYLRDLLATNGAQATYLSATYAKRPDNMPLYFKTDIGQAIGDQGTLMAAMEQGGLPLQTVVSNNLVKAGQLFRRERSYDGVQFHEKTDSSRRLEHERKSDAVTEVLRGIVEADKEFHASYVKQAQKEAEAKGKVVTGGGNKAALTVSHGEFSSVAHNFIRQLLLGLKADAAADQAIEALGRGEKPLIAVDNTMGSFLQAYAEDKGLKQGDPLGQYDYRTVLSRALDRTRYVVNKDAQGNETTTYVPVEHLDPKSRAAYIRAQNTIDALKLDIPVSPIDHIRQRLTDAGHSIAEITGRSLTVDYADPGTPTLGSIPKEELDKVETTRRFNDGRLDAILLNVSGSTGISLHASEKFADQRPRHMIVAQPAQDVNVVMQMLGRIHRTGQVKLPTYTMLSVDLPAEKRPTALLAKKMKSLNANTSSNTESATSVKAADILNKYGDAVVARYLRDNTDLADALDIELPDDGDSANSIPPDLARKATGRLALLPIPIQKAFYADVEQAYNDQIAYLNETNQNELEPRTFDYDAREVKTEPLVPETDPTTPFGEAATYGEYSIKSQGKPLKIEEVQEAMTAALGGKTAKAHIRDMQADLDRDLQAYRATLDPESKTYASTSLVKSIADAFLRDHEIGSSLRVEIKGESYTAVVTDITSAHRGSGNPYALSKITVKLATTGPNRFLKVPATELSRIETAKLWDSPAQVFRNAGTGEARDTAKIITGNLLAAYGELKGSVGTIINFNKADGTSEQGILLPKKFELKSNTRGDYRIQDAAHAIDFLKQSKHEDIGTLGIASRDGNVRVVRDKAGLAIVTPKAKARGAKYFLDPALLKVTGDFVSRGNTMRAEIPQGKETAALDVLMRKGALYAPAAMAEEARGLAPDGPRPLEKGEQDGITYRNAGPNVFDPSLWRNAAGPVKTLIDKVGDTAEKTRIARKIEGGLFDLEPQHDANVLRGLRVLEHMPGTPQDHEEIARAIQTGNFRALNPTQRDIYTKYNEPIRAAALAKTQRIDELEGNPITESDEGYLHRIAVEKGSYLDNLARGKVKPGSGGGGNRLSRKASSSKGRVFFAAVDEAGNRRVVAVKNGQVTAIQNGKSTELGEIEGAPAGKEFVGTNGSSYTIKQATIDEIREHTDQDYYQHAAIADVMNYVEVSDHLDALERLEALKRDPEFLSIAAKPSKGNQMPEGYRRTNLPQFQGWSFEPRTAEVLDDYHARATRGEQGIALKVNHFLTASLLYNPLVHGNNLFFQWLTDKGAAGILNPATKGRQARALVRAYRAVMSRNDDFLQALDAGAPLASQREHTRQFGKVVLAKLADELRADSTALEKMAKLLGYANPLHLLSTMEKYSSRATWMMNDVLLLQAAYERQEAGMGFRAAVNDATRIIPDYRLPTRILDSRLLGQFFKNPVLQAFGGFHYSLVRGFGEIGKSLTGAGWKAEGTNKAGEPVNAAGRTAEQEKRRGLDLLAALVIASAVVYPLLDQGAKEATGDKDAEVARGGMGKTVDDAKLLAQGELTPGQFAQSIITPGIGLKLIAELGLNRDLRNGRRIYNAGDSGSDIAQEIGGRMMNSFGPLQEAQNIGQRGAGADLLGQLLVRHRQHGAEKIASQIIAERNQGAFTPEQEKRYSAKQAALRQLEQGEDAEAQATLADAGFTRKEIRHTVRAATKDPLLAKVTGFNADQIERVMRHATPDEREALMPVLARKLRKEGRSADEEDE